MGKTKRSLPAHTSAVRGCSSLTIIPGLPNEVSATILARLPRALHGTFRCVCCAWRDALQPSVVSALRRNTLRISELWTLFLFLDKSVALYDSLLRRLSFRIPYFRITACNLVVLGSFGSQVFFREDPLDPGPLDPEYLDPDLNEDLSSDIFCFDTASMQWQSDSIPLWNSVWLYNFTSAVLDGHLYVVGGAAPSDGEGVEIVRTARRLNMNNRRWEMMPMMHEKRFGAAAMVVQGRLLVIGGSVNSGHDNDIVEVQSGEIWDPGSSQWTLEPKLWPAQLSQCLSQKDVVVVMGTLYALSSSYNDTEFELFCYESASKTWTSLGQLPPTEDCSCGEGRESSLVGAEQELWVVLNCFIECPTCTAIILKCVPTTRPLPLLWSRVPIVNIPPGSVICQIAEIIMEGLCYGLLSGGWSLSLLWTQQEGGRTCVFIPQRLLSTCVSQPAVGGGIGCIFSLAAPLDTCIFSKQEEVFMCIFPSTQGEVSSARTNALDTYVVFALEIRG